MPRHPIIAVIGATGTGKSDLAVALADSFSGEVINCDAMQFYKSAPIVTNQIPEFDRRGIPHHLLGCADVEDDPWNPHTFSRLALPLIDEIRERGKLPIVVGGSHHYMQLLLFKNLHVTGDVYVNQIAHPILCQSDDAIREKLREVDPVMADRWHPSDMRRIRRSLELWLQHGKPASQIYEEQQLATEAEETRVSMRFPSLIFWVHAQREVLVDRVNRRVESMIDLGLLSEVEKLYQCKTTMIRQGANTDFARGVWEAIGIRSFFPYFDALSSGKMSPEEAITIRNEAVEQTKSLTRRYAKQQIKWIGIKLFQALQDADRIDNFFLLDGTDLNKWTERVQDCAFSVTEKFLRNEPLPKPSSLSEEAEKLLVPRQDYDLSRRRDLWSRKTCDVCNMTAVTEDAWLKHIQGSRHKRALKSMRKREEKARYEEREGA